MLASLFAAAALMATSPDPQTADAEAPRPAVMIAQGNVLGRRVDGVDSFKAIPYAAPPVGEGRWRPPGPAPIWTDALDAGQVGAICIQPPANGDNGVGPLPMSEDCLTLNVWTPAENTGEPLPVMVWIHGGGLNNGSGTAALYDGANLARRGVVLVTLNYRLGRLGFFDHPALAAEREPGEPSANYGLMDVITALHWVRDNAAAFGGDAGNVTVFGESAGGALVTRLMIAPQARGLFHRAVVQSGLGREQGTPLTGLRPNGDPSMQDRGVAFASGLGLGNATAADLRAIPAEQFLAPAPSFYGGDLLVRDGDASLRLALRGVVAANTPGAEHLPAAGEPNGLWLEREVVADETHLTIARATTGQGNYPAISIRFDGVGARRIGAFTNAHVGQRMAVVVGGKILTAPMIQSPITGGSLLIEGDFTAEEAERMADRMTAGQRAERLISEDVETAFAAGREAPVPLIIGSNSAEFWWMKPSDLSPYGAIDGAMTPDEQAAFLAAYGGQDGYDQQVLSDLVFHEPARHLARLHARNGHPAFVYRFDVVSAAMPEPHAGATHASERQYVFDTLVASPWPIAEMDQRAASLMADYWTTFARTGNPNGGDRAVWPEVGADGDQLLEFTNDGPVAKPIPFKDRLDLIEAYYGRIR